MIRVNIRWGAFLSILVACGMLQAHAASVLSEYIAAAVADPDRPPEQVSWDAGRKPVEVLEFVGVKPGERVAAVGADKAKEGALVNPTPYKETEER